MPCLIRLVRETDWPAIMCLQSQAYTCLIPESEAVMRSKQRLGPQSCWVAEHQGLVVGYCLAHPWCTGSPPVLDHGYEAPQGFEDLYIHDVVVSPSMRGRGLARRFLEQARRHAHHHHLNHLALVAVQGAQHYWQRMGFAPQTSHKDLAPYGPEACYMRRASRPDPL